MNADGSDSMSGSCYQSTIYGAKLQPALVAMRLKGGVTPASLTEQVVKKHFLEILDQRLILIMEDELEIAFREYGVDVSVKVKEDGRYTHGISIEVCINA